MQQIARAPTPTLDQQPIQCLVEWWQVALHDLQHALDLGPEVLIGDQVAQSADSRPRDLGRRLPRLGAQVLDGLADHDELEEQRVVQQRRVLASRFCASLGELRTDRADCVPDVPQSLAFIAAHSGKASANT